MRRADRARTFLLAARARDLRSVAWAFAVPLGALVACLPGADDRRESGRSGSADAGVSADAGRDTPSPDALAALAQTAAITRACGAPLAPLTQPLGGTADLSAALATLPTPLSLPCVLAVLPRPLAVVGTTSVISLQPAAGRQNPRIFIQTGSLILSIAMVGDYSTHIETSEPDADGDSVKGDMPFPRATPLRESEIYAGLVDPRGSICSGCHSGERQARLVDGVPAYISRGLRPTQSQLIQPADLIALAQACTPDDQSPRCQMLTALFRDPSAIQTMVFPSNMGTISGTP